jgi:ankyrin repeat protein
MILTDSNIYTDDEICESLDDYFVNGCNSAVNHSEKSDGYKDDSFKIAISYMFSDELDKFKNFIKHNTRIINKISDGVYLLHLACYIKKYDFVLSLLLSNADPDNRDDQNKTAAHYAVISGDTSIINILTLYGVDLDIQDSDGDTPLHYAVSNNDYEMIKTLIRHNVNPMIENNNNMVAINYTIDKQILKELSIYMEEYIK